jgi:PHD and RING finger domain-containing protein 1
VVDEVKLALKPHYARKKVNKEQYKEILRRAVPKVFILLRIAILDSILMGFDLQICHTKTKEINPHKVRRLVNAYVKKICGSKKSKNNNAV